LDALVGHAAIARIVVLAQDVEGLIGDPGLAAYRDNPAIRFAQSGNGISASVIAVLDDVAPPPVLLTTADNVLLTRA
ncbi:hypothetical protein ACC848_45425, partial [Rhizobium johnstonii]